MVHLEDSSKFKSRLISGKQVQVREIYNHIGHCRSGQDISQVINEVQNPTLRNVVPSKIVA